MSDHLRVIPLPIKLAKRFVGQEHRHHPHLVGAMWAIGAVLDGRLVGVAVVGYPKARGLLLDPLKEPPRLEVTRCATDGTRNACSFLYGRARRVMQVMGCGSGKTYTLVSESGASLKALGLKPEKRIRGRYKWRWELLG